MKNYKIFEIIKKRKLKRDFFKLKIFIFEIR